jgi:hypothetical protein
MMPSGNPEAEEGTIMFGLQQQMIAISGRLRVSIFASWLKHP